MLLMRLSDLINDQQQENRPSFKDYFLLHELAETKTNCVILSDSIWHSLSPQFVSPLSRLRLPEMDFFCTLRPLSGVPLYVW